MSSICPDPDGSGRLPFVLMDLDIFHLCLTDDVASLVLTLLSRRVSSPGIERVARLVTNIYREKIDFFRA